MKTVELNSCPFCGGEAKVIHTRVIADDAVRVICTECNVHTAAVLINHPAYTAKSNGELDESTRYTEDQAVAKAAEKWNRRAE